MFKKWKNTQYNQTDKYGDKYFIQFTTINKKEGITQRIRDDLNSNRKKIIFKPHTEKQMEKRGVDYKDVNWVLLFGENVETRVYEKRPNNPRQIFKGKDYDGLRKLKVSVVEETNIVVITVIN